jgi:hypothetical protein
LSFLAGVAPVYSLFPRNFSNILHILPPHCLPRFAERGRGWGRVGGGEIDGRGSYHVEGCFCGYMGSDHRPGVFMTEEFRSVMTSRQPFYPPVTFPEIRLLQSLNIH